MLHKPFGFLGSTAGDTGWDPSLGETLTVSYWWDFTSLDYVEVDGSSNVVLVTPRNLPVEEDGEATLANLGSGKDYTNSGSWSEGGGITLENAVLISSSNLSLNWALAGVNQGDAWSCVTIAANNNWQGNPGQGDSIAVWNISNSAYDSLNVFSGTGTRGSVCSGSGTYVNSMGSYDGDWADGRGVSSTTNPSGSANGYVPNMYIATWNGPAGAPYPTGLAVNNNVSCSFSLGRNSTTAHGLCIGAAPTLSHNISFSGSYFHHVYYNGILTQDQMIELYDTWVEAYTA